MEMYKDRFKDASDFTFYFVGNIDVEKMKPMIAKYLGGLPSINRKETFKDTKMEIRKGQYKNEFAKKQETPMATIMFLFNGTCKYDLRNNLTLSISIRHWIWFTPQKSVRKKGGYLWRKLQRKPHQISERTTRASDCIPDRSGQERQTIGHRHRTVGKNGQRRSVCRTHAEDQRVYAEKIQRRPKENGYWLGNLDEYFYTGIDYTKDYETLVNSITAKDVQEFLAKLMKQNNEIQVIMTVPEEEAK